MSERIYSNHLADVEYKDDILYIRYKGLTATLAEMKEFVGQLKQLFGDLYPLPLLTNISKQKSPKKEVRDYIASPEVSSLTTASAIVANSTLSKIASNLFLVFNKPTIPVKIFTDEAAAVAWLQQFK